MSARSVSSKVYESSSKTALQSAFLRLYAVRSCGAISVSLLCSEASVARSTFYAHYGNLAELKGSIEDHLIADLQRAGAEHFSCPAQPLDLRAHMRGVIAGIIRSWDANYLFLVVRPNLEYIGKWKQKIRDRVLLLLDSRLAPADRDFRSEVIASGLIGAYTYLLQKPKTSCPAFPDHYAAQLLQLLVLPR